MKPFIFATLGAAMLAPVSVAADGDPSKGQRVFNRCKACHAVGEGAANKVGPELNGIVGRAAGENPDFRYSDALMARAEEGLVWDEESLTAFITKPRDFLPGTAMSYAGMRKESDTIDLIAYLATFE